MLNKKKVAIVIAIVVIIALIIVVIVMQANKKSKVALLYDKLTKSESYSFDMKDNENYEIIVSKKGDKTCIDNNGGDEKTSTIVKDGTTYLILHSQKEYYTYDSDIAEENIITDMFEEIVDAKCEKGKDKINGKTYKYEEYAGFAGFMFSTGLDVDEENVKTRFYFDGDNLVYIKTILAEEEELLEVEISYDVADELFEIPSDYAETD